LSIRTEKPNTIMNERGRMRKWEKERLILFFLIVEYPAIGFFVVWISLFERESEEVWNTFIAFLLKNWNWNEWTHHINTQHSFFCLFNDWLYFDTLLLLSLLLCFEFGVLILLWFVWHSFVHFVGSEWFWVLQRGSNRRHSHLLNHYCVLIVSIQHHSNIES
jgi:hypothetical protein